MAIIQNTSTYSTIQIKQDIHFVFGTLDGGDNPVEKIKIALDAFKDYFKRINIEPPQVVMNWKNGNEGDWVLSDDYRIVQIIKRKDHYYEKSYNKAVIRTCVGTFAVNPKTYFDTDFELHPDRYRISADARPHKETIEIREEVTTSEAAFARRIAKGQNKVEAYMRSFPTKNRTRAVEMSNILIKQERIQKQVLSDVEEIMNREGVTKDYIIARYRELIDNGILDLKNCAPAVRSALKDLADMAAMMPSKNTHSQQTKGQFEEFADEMLNEIEATEAQLVDDDVLKLPESVEFIDDFKQEFAEEETVDIINKAGRSLLK